MITKQNEGTICSYFSTLWSKTRLTLQNKFLYNEKVNVVTESIILSQMVTKKIKKNCKLILNIVILFGYSSYLHSELGSIMICIKTINAKPRTIEN